MFGVASPQLVLPAQCLEERISGRERESGEKSEREGELRRDGKKEEWVRIQRGFRDCDGNELHCPARAGRTESSFGTRKEEGRLEHRISSSAKKNERRK